MASTELCECADEPALCTCQVLSYLTVTSVTITTLLVNSFSLYAFIKSENLHKMHITYFMMSLTAGGLAVGFLVQMPDTILTWTGSDGVPWMLAVQNFVSVTCSAVTIFSLSGISFIKFFVSQISSFVRYYRDRKKMCNSYNQWMGGFGCSICSNYSSYGL